MKFALLFGLIVTAVCAVAVAQSPSKFEDCGSAGAKTTKVVITPCDTDPCTVTPGKTSSIQVYFHSNMTADNITAKAYGSIGHLRLPYKLPQPDACKKSNLTCPLEPNKDYDYTFSLTIPTEIPHVSVLVELDLIVKNLEHPYMCIDFPIIVKMNNADLNMYKKLKNHRFP